MKKKMNFEEALNIFMPLGKEILDWMNDHPEISGHEKQTCAYLVKQLRDIKLLHLPNESNILFLPSARILL